MGLRNPLATIDQYTGDQGVSKIFATARNIFGGGKRECKEFVIRWRSVVDVRETSRSTYKWRMISNFQFVYESNHFFITQTGVTVLQPFYIFGGHKAEI